MIYANYDFKYLIMIYILGTSGAALMVANALLGSRLDYCNSLFRSLSALNLRKLQFVQNSFVRIVTNTTNYSHIAY